MKIEFIKRRHTQKQGFALIASLTLMMLLGLIAVGMLAVVSSQNRAASHASLQAEARQQALMGLDAALAEMQMALGPDQRVTASSGILTEDKSTHQHILGVWDSWQHALYDKSEQGIKSTYTDGRRNKFRRWLISSRNPQELSSMEAVYNLGTRDPGRRVCLVGAGTLGSRADSKLYVYADMVDMPASGKNTGSYAWWVSGDNQKANATLQPREKSDKVEELLHRTWDTPPPSFRQSRTLSFLDALTPEERRKIITLNTLALPGVSTPGVDREWYYDVTHYSRSLLVNVRDGGLKYDLNLLLDKDSLKNTPYAERSDQDCPLANDLALPTGTEPKMPIGSWQTLHAYYNTYPTGAGGKNDDDVSARLCGSIDSAYTRICGDMVRETTVRGDNVTYFDTRARDNDSKAGYARSPILTTFLGCWGLSVRLSAYKHRYSVTYQYSPMIMWWNPYNVQMRVRAKKLWAYALPYRTTSVQSYSDRAVKVDPERPWSAKMVIHPCSGGVGFGWQCCFRLDWGNYFVNSQTDQTSDIIFEPGEILAFTMSGNIISENEIDEVGDPMDCPFVVGDQPDVMTNYSMEMHEYVNISDPTATSGLNEYIDRLCAKLTLENHKFRTFDGNEGYGPHTQAAWLVTMGEVLMSGAHYEDVAHHHQDGRTAFCVVHGYDGLDVQLTENRAAKRLQGAVDARNGARGISPGSYTLGWYDYDNIPEDGMVFLNSKWNANMVDIAGVYYVAVGIVPKSYNQQVNDGFPMFKGKDYRTKSWQHSSPALWGSALYNPDEQQRQYHPYQLAAIPLGAGLNRGPMDTINGRNGVYGIFGSGVGGGENVSFISVLEAPLHPPFSLAGFAGMRLTPGWYEKSGLAAPYNSISRMRRIQYQAGVPGVGIGNSFADPCLPPDGVYAYHETKINPNVRHNGRIFSDYFDHGLIINDALWDRWFCSSISRMPRGGDVVSAKETFKAFMEDDQPLPVSRYKKALTPQKREEIISRIMDKDDGWRHIARYLVIEGGFNVNSVSEEAWAATLQGLANRELLTNANKKLSIINKTDGDVLFSRFAVSTAQRALDHLGYDPLQGSSALRPGLKMSTAWGEVRALDPEGIRELARQIVKQVRARGPFLNMSDFINRRLDGGSDSALTGALQAAIDATDINDMFKDQQFEVRPAQQGSLYKYPDAAKGSMYTAAPGYLIQSDVLSSLGNILTVRDDTFTVRAYGCVRNSRRAVLAQAWCEATVQRTIEYTDPVANSPEDSDRLEDDSRTNGSAAKRLSELNRVMGRKLKVISFRWLDSWDI